MEDKSVPIARGVAYTTSGMQKLLADAARWETLLEAPCIFCGYKGAGYWQSGTHKKNCRWHSIGGSATRVADLMRVK